MKVDRHVEASAAEPASHGQVVAHAAKPRALRHDDDLVEMRIAGNDRRGRRLDEIGDVCVGETVPKRPDARRRQRDVAEKAKSNEEDPGQGSTVASSMSMTGMSSLMG
jgi:hypothetical protein